MKIILFLGLFLTVDTVNAAAVLNPLGGPDLHTRKRRSVSQGDQRSKFQTAGDLTAEEGVKIESALHASKPHSPSPTRFFYEILDGEGEFKPGVNYLEKIDGIAKTTDLGKYNLGLFYKRYAEFCLEEESLDVARAAEAYHRVLKLAVFDTDVNNLIGELGLSPSSATKEDIQTALEKELLA